MRGMPFNLLGKGVLEVVVEARGAREEGSYWSSGACGSNKRKKGEGLEPRSVLDNRRSPSPPTSTSTLSSSLGGGGSLDTADVAAVSDNNPAHKWLPSDSTAEEGGGEGGRKEEWASELQPIPAGIEMGEKCGLGVEDWEAMLSESVASPGQEQTFLRWVMGDVDDPSSVGGGLKHHLLSQGPVDFDSNTGTLEFGLVDPGFGFDPIGGMGGGTSISASSAVSLPPLASSGGGFPQMSNNNRNNLSAPLSQPAPAPAGLHGVKAPSFGNPPNNPIFSQPLANSHPLPMSLPPAMFFQETMDEKPHLFNPSLLLNHQQQAHGTPNSAFFLPLPSFPVAQPEHHLLLPPHPKRHHSMPLNPTCQISPKTPFSDPGHQSFPQLHAIPYHLQHRPSSTKPKAGSGDEAAAAAHHQQQLHQALVDQLFKAAELVEAGNSVSARGILARLNQQLPSSLGMPLLRSAFYFKESLNLLLANNPNPSPSSSPTHQHPPPFSTPLVTSWDVVLKLNAYKAFSEVSPLLHFTNFTCAQILLEELGGFDRIHIIEFDIGVGGQWSSFMQELAQRHTSSIPLLKITAFVSPSSFHPLELHLTHDNLKQFATDLNIPFEFSILNIDSFDPAELLSMSTGSNEAIAVNLAVGSSYNPCFPTLLRLVKQLSPKIVVSVDRGCDRSDLPFSHHFLHAFQSSMVLLDSIDAAGTNSDAVSKIERFLVQPMIESSVIGRRRAADKMLPWRTLFASAGFVSVQFSNFTETQAECLLKRVQVRGFHVEKCQASLVLCWQHGELASVSAWKC